jgi:uncharacterized pyridoxal phosphate-containing UPF0001 family protein
VVSKTWPVSDLEVLVDLGVRDFGENRAEELTQKAEHFAGRALRWHFLGQIQSKKAAGIARVAHVVHSLDRSKLVPGLARGAVDAGRVLEAFLQVSLAELAPQDDASGRGGAAPQEWPVLAAAVAEQPSVGGRHGAAAAARGSAGGVRPAGGDLRPVARRPSGGDRDLGRHEP